MNKKIVIYIGVVLGGIGTIGEILMFAAKASGRNVGVLIFWAVVLGISLYFMNEEQKKAKSKK